VLIAMDPVSRLNARLRNEQIDAETSPRVQAWKARRAQEERERRAITGILLGALLGAGVWWLLLKVWL